MEPNDKTLDAPDTMTCNGWWSVRGRELEKSEFTKSYASASATASGSTAFYTRRERSQANAQQPCEQTVEECYDLS